MMAHHYNVTLSTHITDWNEILQIKTERNGKKRDEYMEAMQSYSCGSESVITMRESDSSGDVNL